MKNLFLTFLISIFSVAFFFTCTNITWAAPSLTSVGTISSGRTYFGFPTEIGDVNGDGYDDIVASDYNFSTAGMVNIYYGGTSFNNTLDASILGEESSNYFGFAESAAISLKDITNDGKSELLAGAWGYSSSNGRFYAFNNKDFVPGLSANTAELQATGNGTDRYYFGMGIGAGDFDGDGDNDIVIAAPTSVANQGAIQLFQNNNGVIDFDNRWGFTTVTNVRLMGYMNGVKIGDFNGDGRDDILTGDNYSYAGYIGKDLDIFLSVGDGSLTEVNFSTAAAGDYFGRAGTFHTGDINNDGKDDFCAGAYLYNSYAGRITCWYGRETFLSSYAYNTADVFINGGAANDSFGRAVDIADVNNDGYPDLMVGAYQAYAPAGSTHGKAYVYKNTGTGSGIDTSSPWISEIKTSGNAYFGSDINSGDIDADGWKDIAVLQGNGASVLNMYEMSHGSPSITFISTTTGGNLVGTSSDSDASYTLAGVGWSTSNTLPGTWTACTANDSTFDESTEAFTCDLSAYANGTYSLYFRSYDQNSVYMSTQLYASDSITVDKNPPNVLSLSPASAGIISTATPTLTGTLNKTGDCRASTTDESYDNMSDNVDCTGDGTVSASCAIPALGLDGSKTLYISCQDDSGYKDSTATNEEIIYTLDTLAPSIIMDSLTTPTSDATTSFTGTANDVTSPIQTVEYQVDTTSGSWIACTAYDSTFDEASETVTCTISPALSDGIHTIYFRAQDDAGHYVVVSNYGEEQITIDTIAPTPDSTRQKIGTKDEPKQLKGIGTEVIKKNSKKFKLYFDLKDATSSIEHYIISQNRDFEDSSWKAFDGDASVEFKADGKKQLYIRFKDAAGNISDTFEQTIQIDTQPPELQVTKIGTFEPDFTEHKNYFYSENLVRIAGTVEKDADLRVYVNNGLIEDIQDINELGNWEVTHDFNFGKSEVRFEAEDDFKNITKLEFNLTIDSIAQTTQQALGTFTQMVEPSLQPEELEPAGDTVEIKTEVQGTATATPVKKTFWQNILGWFGIKY
ncbi:hypothetical protein A3K34_04240 [candidate division WWE3 bacterium RIFOXYC1_FULL_40_10]|uniref:Bacterial Ig-like domain-containing protein n=1 Tax=candidate division WWE3 bacterium RIFOXYA2_FULL_46_9 TaxID=1802636 RepID=A0A1F4W0L7_UNCKA|nr:MAG: hypothetical protein A3K58_04240 [candidate division WWE3 bacterium RIFOXYB1_FULL_40_22]OGC62051.1 MAG: hypothetical protein A3K37_04240 [candidate division WWE3 bacterium RIFOXYA1_FULL_40_11]OGC62969.1 MAG: hypothetical protein A2264_03765 [candidate division WWE3 bacterium RIFOXYA2_FULL_46_9]OGC65004.1 MAG: hypothetical protein A2326_03125 [candidate division WWE3 bacterium RIFOXYB2_FULL_41_6]OGC66434.1 MAG: hypothetical protein A3K34_04240 [candidate division WWE3 bacterium RIFOXYC1_